MKNQKMYESDDKMITLIRDDYNVLQSLGSFGINFGFGDKTVKEICQDNGVDTYTFLAIVNFTINGYSDFDDDSQLSVPTLIHYLEASHVYYLDFQLPMLRKQLQEAVADTTNGLGGLIIKFFDEYSREIRKHMMYEEKSVFPYVEQLLAGKVTSDYNIETFSKHHSQTDKKLSELKNVIIKYIPSDKASNNKLTMALHGIYMNEEWLRNHGQVEERIFVPAITRLEHKMKQNAVSQNISSMVFNGGPNSSDSLSDREKDVIVSLVQGMSNKEIAEHLFISINTVITHRRNIARKLQIHSSAGLTIYAIVNGLVDISSVKL